MCSTPTVRAGPLPGGVDIASRIISWNIRAGGGRRVTAIAGQLARWRPDIVALSEFRGTPPSVWLAQALGDAGLSFQECTADSARASANCLLVASRWPLRRVRLRQAPVAPGRWLLAEVDGPSPFTLGAMHIPNRVTGFKEGYLDAVLKLAGGWRRGPALLLGDTNTGCIGVDEESPAFNAREDGWMRGLARLGWSDAFRQLRGEERAYTWYSPNGGNGFRLDQAFVNRRLLPCLHDARYVWGTQTDGDSRRDALSDHAALIVDLDLSRLSYYPSDLRVNRQVFALPSSP
jgi:exonuclease III